MAFPFRVFIYFHSAVKQKENWQGEKPCPKKRKMLRETAPNDKEKKAYLLVYPMRPFLTPDIVTNNSKRFD